MRQSILVRSVLVVVALIAVTVNARAELMVGEKAARLQTGKWVQGEPVAGFDTTQNKFVALPIDLGPATDQVFLVLFGTGLRFRSSLAAVTAKIGGADATVTFAGAVPGFIGLDQANLAIPRSLIGRGEVDVMLTVDGKAANTLKVSIK